MTGVLERQIAALGEARAMVVDCLGGNGRFTPVRFVVGSDDDHVAAFRTFVTGLLALPGGEAAPGMGALLAAGRLLLGEIGAAGRIVDRFPMEPFRVDHGAGYCNGAHLTALRWAVPLPEALRDVGRWVVGSPEQAGIRSHPGEAVRPGTDVRAWLSREGALIRAGATLDQPQTFGGQHDPG